MYAAPFEDSLKDNNDTDGIINRKRQHNKTQKVYPKGDYDTDKVNSVLDKIHENPGNPDNEGDNLGDFNPPPPPKSSGTRKTNTTEQMYKQYNDSKKKKIKENNNTPQQNYKHNKELGNKKFNKKKGE